MQLGTQGILQHLRKVYIPLQRSGIKPSGEGDGAVDAAVDPCQADGGHIHIHKDGPFAVLQLYIGQRGGGGDILAVLLQSAEDAAQQFPCGQQRIRIVAFVISEGGRRQE